MCNAKGQVEATVVLVLCFISLIGIYKPGVCSVEARDTDS